MKTRLKKKTDMKKTGNRSITLLDWERKLLKAMKGEENPTIGKILGALEVGVSCTDTNADFQIPSTSRCVQDASCTSALVRPPFPSKRKLVTDKYETVETEQLSTKELQRLVLLQQYHTSVIQHEYYSRKLEKMGENITKTVTEGNTTFFNL